MTTITTIVATSDYYDYCYFYDLDGNDYYDYDAYYDYYGLGTAAQCS